MPNTDPRTQSSPPPVVALVQYAGQTDHFAGVDAALAAMSVRPIRVTEWELDELSAGGVGLVAVKDCESPLALAALRWARRGGAREPGVPTLLLMDGVVEHRNTFRNPDAPENFLRPAPVDVVVCAGEADRANLWSWGNHAVATGLPRIGAEYPAPLPTVPPGEGRLLIATAKKPAFGAAERSRLVGALRELKRAVEQSEWKDRALWRLTAGLDDEIGVTSDPRPLRECLAVSAAVLTTPSTLLLEAMAAARPCAILHPQAGPLWQQAMAVWRGDEVDPQGALRAMLGTLLAPTEADWLRQSAACARMHGDGSGHGAADAPARVATVMVSMLLSETGSGPGRARELPGIARFAPGLGAESRSARRRIVSCVSCDSTPIGGVMTWSLRMGREFAARAGELGYEFRTLVVAMQPDGWRSEEFDPTAESGAGADGGVDLCVLDPMAEPHERVETVRAALEALGPDIVLPNYNDVCFMAAALLRPATAGGVRTVMVAHADDAYYRTLAATYDTWAAAVGVSAACAEWLRPLARGRRLERIECAVPVASAPTALPGVLDPGAPLRIAYIGRMVEEQKRIGDLLALLDELEARAIACELHMVGDGPDLAAWKSLWSLRRHRHTRVVQHGRRSPVWVEGFLPTVDACVLVSAYEGTSVVMLEAMGRGVVPVVTAVRSGVGEWVRDGENGVVSPIGDMAAMARALADLCADRGRLGGLGVAAWRTIRDSGLSVASTAATYASVCDHAMAHPIDPRPTDAGLRPMDLWRWGMGSAPARADEADEWCERSLRASGYRRIAMDRPEAGCDAVLVRTSGRGGGGRPVSSAEIESWRASGLGVAVSPHLVQHGLVARVMDVVEAAIARGALRIAVYPAGRHTRRIAPIFRPELWAGRSGGWGSNGSRTPFVGFLDDAARPGQQVMGLPVVKPGEALAALAPDTLLLSSDSIEAELWERTADLRRAGIRVLRLYSAADEPVARVVKSQPKETLQGVVGAHSAL